MIGSVDGVGLNEIQTLRQECETTNNWTPLTNILMTVFGDMHALGYSFPKIPDTTPSHHCPVDKLQAQLAFKLIKSECPPFLFKRVTDQVRKLIQKCVLNKDDPLDLIRLNAIVILFQCPVYIDVLYPNNLLTELCEFIANIDIPLQDKLVDYLVEPSQHDQTTSLAIFNNLLSIFHHMVRVRLIIRTTPVSNSSPSPSSSSSSGTNSDPVVAQATKCLAILYRMNEKYHLVPYTEFYNEAVNDHLEIKEDFPNFKDHKGFSFCDYPFVLNPVVKADILKIESVYQMRHELQDAFFRALFQGVNSPYLVLEIRRDHIIQDTLQQLEEKSIQDLKKQLRIQFVGEEGVDEGGVQKEFFQLMIRELFDSKYGMFTFNDESRLCWFNSHLILDDNKGEDRMTIREYKLLGLLIGLAVYNSVTLDLHFPLALYKKLMNVPVDVSDLKQLDPSLGQGLERLLLMDQHSKQVFSSDEEFDHYFQVDVESFGHMKTVDLKPNGGSILVTKDNRKEFVNLYVDFLLNKVVEKQFAAFQMGFNLICQDCAIKIFRPEEIEQLICGSSDLDFYALEKSTVYDGGWNEKSTVIKYFWEIVHDFTYEERKKLLFFATGSDRAPIGGLSKLQFVIAKNGGDSDRLPTSHTCYNVLLLCEYGSKEKLRERLMTSISNSEGFGMI
ncbi:hypothetical protein BC941DRAFT_505374 [Chlamydoabsidia padenii]|nr:hypothetical protein BC941DRAFT_505374 [Chlamydoabsidia padenii]